MTMTVTVTRTSIVLFCEANCETEKLMMQRIYCIYTFIFFFLIFLADGQTDKSDCQQHGTVGTVGLWGYVASVTSLTSPTSPDFPLSLSLNSSIMFHMQWGPWPWPHCRIAGPVIRVIRHTSHTSQLVVDSTRLVD